MKTRALVLAAGTLLAATGWSAPFQDGDRVVFYGDSITHGGYYAKMLADFYLTRYPDRAVRFYNAGVAGDNAGAAMGRFDEDVRRWNPTVVTLMFGMNDSWRDMYDPERMKDPKYRAGVPAREKQCLDNYTNNLTRLVQRLRKDTPAARLMFLTPTPYDETAVQKGPKPTPALKGTVAALKRFADFGKKTAAETGSEVVDWNTSYQKLVVDGQRKNPEFTFVRPDRVHPDAPGHLFMAYEFLKAQGATNPVSDVALSAKDGKVLKCVNAEVDAFARTVDGCAFTLLEKALPWPIQKNAESALPLARILEDLDRETLAVKDLEKGARYELRIDGESVGEWTAGELAWGVNLARNARTPQFRQAAEVEKANAARHAVETGPLRMFAASRWYLRLRHVDPDDREAVQAHYDGLANKNGYFERRLPDYIRDYGRKAELEKDLDARWAELLKLRVPKAHRYELRKLPAVNPDAAPKNASVRHIQRTMKAMAESTAEKPAHVKILFYGQSIVGQHWSRQVMDELKRRYPTVKFEVQNRAIGGYGAERLSRTAESDLYPYYPDLLFFHVYGGLKKYEEIVRKVRATTTAEIVLWSSHLSKGQRAQDMLAERDLRTRTIADIAERYGAMYVDLNRKWSEMLLKNGWAEYDILADGIHMNARSPALDLYAQILYEDMARLPGTDAEPAVNGSVECVPLSDPRVKKGADGSLTLAFTGNRVVAVSDGTGAAGATGTLTLDGKDPATFPELWYTTRPGTGPMWMPFVDHVDIDAPAVAEQWTLTFLEGTATNANPVVYSVVGSVTGPDGTGSTKARFRSNSGRAVLDPKDINCVWQYSYSKKQAKVGFQVKWETKPLFTASYAPAPAETCTTLVQNCANGPHELSLAARNGALGIKGFLVYAPRR